MLPGFQLKLASFLLSSRSYFPATKQPQWRDIGECRTGGRSGGRAGGVCEAQTGGKHLSCYLDCVDNLVYIGCHVFDAGRNLGDEAGQSPQTAIPAQPTQLAECGRDGLVLSNPRKAENIGRQCQAARSLGGNSLLLTLNGGVSG